MSGRIIRACALALFGLGALAIGGCRDDKAAAGNEHAGHAAGHQLSVTVDALGFHPSSLTAPANQHVRITFKRTSDEGCGQQIVFPSADIRRDLPLNQPVDVDVTMPASGSLAFQCGMGMLRGAIVAQ